jgi:hypothetical protein
MSRPIIRIYMPSQVSRGGGELTAMPQSAAAAMALAEIKAVAVRPPLTAYLSKIGRPAQAEKPVVRSCTAAAVTLDTKAEHAAEHVRAPALPQCSPWDHRIYTPVQVFNGGRLADVSSPHSSSRGMITIAGS